MSDSVLDDASKGPRELMGKPLINLEDRREKGLAGVRNWKTVSDFGQSYISVRRRRSRILAAGKPSPNG